MTHPDEDLLTATEGVDEGSAAARPRGNEESDPAPPAEVDDPEIRRAAATGTGQQLAAGEG